MKQARFGAQIHERLATYEIEDIRRYAELLERLLANEARRLDAELDKISSGLPEAARNEYLENRSDEYQELTALYPNELRLGLTTSAYSVLEGRVTAIAKTLLWTTKSSLELSDFAGESPLARAQKSIEKISRLDIPAQAWKRLEPYRRVRNAVVHGSGVFQKGLPQQLKEFVDASPNISVDRQGHIVVTGEFLNDFLGDMEAFYKLLFQAWRSWATIRPVAL